MTVKAVSTTILSDASGDVTDLSLKGNGYLVGIFIQNVVQPSANWDIVISEKGTARNLYTNATISNAADTDVVPVLDRDAGAGFIVDKLGAAVVSDVGFMKIPIAGGISIVGANMGAAKSAIVTLYIEE